jgi:hypothetical protein
VPAVRKHVVLVLARAGDGVGSERLPECKWCLRRAQSQRPHRKGCSGEGSRSRPESPKTKPLSKRFRRPFPQSYQHAQSNGWQCDDRGLANEFILRPHNTDYRTAHRSSHCSLKKVTTTAGVCDGAAGSRSSCHLYGFCCHRRRQHFLDALQEPRGACFADRLARADVGRVARVGSARHRVVCQTCVAWPVSGAASRASHVLPDRSELLVPVVERFGPHVKAASTGVLLASSAVVLATACFIIELRAIRCARQDEAKDNLQRARASIEGVTAALKVAGVMPVARVEGVSTICEYCGQAIK